MSRYLAALIAVLAAVLIGCSGTDTSAVVEEALGADPSAVLEQAVQAMEANPRFRVIEGWIGSEGEAVLPELPDWHDLQFVLPDRFSSRRAPGYEVIPFITVVGNHTYASADGIHWEELGRETGAEFYPMYYRLRWDPYGFLRYASNPADGGTASVDGKRCRVIEADLDIDAWGNGTGWATDGGSVRLVVYVDSGSYLPHRVTVLWRREFPQGTTESPYVIDIRYDETIAIEPPEEVLTKDELLAITSARNPMIEESAGELVRILSAFKEANGVFPDRLDLETVGDVMRAAGLEWPANPTTGAPMADDEPIPGNFFYLPMDDGGNYQMSVCSYYSCSRLTYHGVPPEPTIIPQLTDEQKEIAVEVALADPRVQELLEGRPYDVGGVGIVHMGSRLLAATVRIQLEEPAVIEFDWPSGRYDPLSGDFVEVTRRETAGVEGLQIEVSFEFDEEKVTSIQPSFSPRVFR